MKGWSLKINGIGNRLIIGAPEQRKTMNKGKSRVYIYDLNTNTNDYLIIYLKMRIKLITLQKDKM